jgi:hypothetical protein
MLSGVELSIAQPAAWTLPQAYDTANISQTISKILLGQAGII